MENPLSPPQDLPLSKLRGFGGKLGEQLEALGCTTAGQVRVGIAFPPGFSHTAYACQKRAAPPRGR